MSVSEYTSFISMLDYVGLDSKDYIIVDMAQEDIPPALISGSVDIMISGIPQRLAVHQRGYTSLIDQTTLPNTISHNGFAAHRKWIDEHPELAKGLSKAMFKTFQYIEDHPDEAFPIIVKHMKSAGTEITVDQLKGVWNKMEFFPGSKTFFEKEVVANDGRFYWKDRFQNVVNIMESEGKIPEGSVNDLQSLYYALKIIKGID